MNISRTLENSGDVLENLALRPLEVLLVDALGERHQRVVAAHRLRQLAARQPRRDYREHVPEHQRVQLRWTGTGIQFIIFWLASRYIPRMAG